MRETFFDNRIIILNRSIETELVKKAMAGDASAFNEVYLLFRDSVYSFVYRMLGESSAAEDITQETFVFLIEHPEKYLQERGSLPAFLYGVARNRIMHHLRKHGKVLETSVEEIDNYCEQKDEMARDPLRVLLDEEFMTKVEESLAVLPPLQREAIILRELQELSYEEIAKISGENINTVKVRVYRARRTLASLLALYVNCERRSCYAVR